MKILAIETSCDETAISIAEFFGSKSRPRIKVLSNIVSSQVKLHAKYGGVVPNLAKREHQRNLVPILLSALKEMGLRISNFQFPKFASSANSGASPVGSEDIRFQPKQTPKSKIPKLEKILEREQELLKQFIKKVLPLKPPPIDAIAVTYGPGLAPALWVGVNFAKALACLWNKPLIPVNHMAGHLYSAFLQKSGVENYQLLVTSYPAIALLVSGGHTELVLMHGHGKFKIIGETLDDAAGEAFDKVARILGLGYPGGPQISALAEISQTNADYTQTNAERRRRSASSPRMSALRLPRPILNSKDYNFSFSGLKTAVLYLVRDLGIENPSTGSTLSTGSGQAGSLQASSGSIRKRIEKLRPAIAKEFQDAVVEVLVKKTIRAAKEYKVKTILLGGGVAANKLLRKKLGEEIKKNILDIKYLIPDTSLTGDNALMIALAAHFKWASLAPGGRAAFFVEKKKALDKVGADANARLS